MMHEWMDGRSAQYKSCHCMGDVAQSSSDFSYVTVRNYFETPMPKVRKMVLVQTSNTNMCMSTTFIIAHNIWIYLLVGL